MLQKVKKIVADQLGQAVEELDVNKTFKELGADSLDLVELVMALEEEFAVEIPDDDKEKITTTAQAAEYLEKALAGK